jgi:peptide/nickel transport system substrate-binding protein
MSKIRIVGFRTLLWRGGTALSALIILASCASTPTTSSAPLGASGAPTASGGTAVTKDTLVIGADISDTRTLDPHRQFDTSPYMTMHAVYEGLLTVTPADYNKFVPQLATSWDMGAGGTTFTFHLRSGVKFASGNPMTAADVKFSFDRLKNLKDTPSVVAANIASVDVVDPLTVKITLTDPKQPFLSYLMGSGTWGIVDSVLAIKNGATSDPGADKTDKGTAYLDQHSAGTGPYMMTSWERNNQIVMERNPNYWGTKAPFARVIIRNFSDSSAELLALQRGDIDVAQGLNADQLATVQSDPTINVSSTESLDLLYWTICGDPAKCPQLAKPEVRQAISYAVDFDGLIKGLLGGFAVRPPAFMPIGLGGMTKEFAQQHQITQDVAKAKTLLASAGVSNGFSFDLSYGDSTFAGVKFADVAQQIQSDLAAVNITVNLKPMDTTTFTTAFRAGQVISGLAPWASDGPEPYLYASAAVRRLAARALWTPSQAQIDLVDSAPAEQDSTKRDAIYQQYILDQIQGAHYLIPFQPVFRVASRKAVSNVNLTAAGWSIEISQITPGN